MSAQTANQAVMSLASYAGAPATDVLPDRKTSYVDQVDAVQATAIGFDEFLLKEKVIDSAALDRAQRAARTTGARLDQVLTTLGLISEADLALALSKYLSIPLVTASDLPAEPIMPELIEGNYARRNKLMPLSISEDRLVVGVVDPLNEEPTRALAYLTGRPVAVHIFIAADYEKAFEAVYGGQGPEPKADSGSADAAEIDVQRLRDMASEAPTIRLVNQLISRAVELKASDIHIEPTVDSVLVRYRIDGSLRTAQTLAAGLRAAITSRIKIMSKLDIAERRLPQDGRIKIAIRGVDIDFRVSTIPTVFGESVVMRILDRTRVALDFIKLGFSDEHITALKELLDQPNGIILVTGPTGSGKTTTLYTALKGLNNEDSKIFTVEDPIEYQLTGINQVQVQPAIAFDFPHALRSILRQDPDIIMIGEIRDLETARIAIQSSLTGHLVLSTLHTNSAAATITRLIDMGVENYLLASTVKGILAQRLVRTLCPHCACAHPEAAFWSSELSRQARGIDQLGPAMIRQARGCDHCNQTGFSGRSTIAEILLVNTDVQRLILSTQSDADIEQTARQHGMVSMYETGAAKVWRGETTIEEVLRATRMG
jgi:general secretion pathway protein E